MPAPIDHIVIVVHDLDRAAAAYERLGFTLTPRAEHPWGTANRLVQFIGGNFIELLEIDRPALIPDHQPENHPRVFSFGAAARRFLETAEGMGLLALQGRMPPYDEARFQDAGFENFAPFKFERSTTLPDGTTRHLAFTLNFAASPALQTPVFFTCYHHYPKNFWKAEFQAHDNGAQTIAELVMLAKAPQALKDFLEKTCEAQAKKITGGFALDLDPGLISVLDPKTFDERFPGEKTDIGDTPHFAAIVIEGGQVTPGFTPASEAFGLAIEWRGVN